MRRASALLIVLAITAFMTGCSSSGDSTSNTTSASNANANVKSSTAPPAANTSTVDSGRAVGGAAPPQARPSSPAPVGIKPPTKNGR